MWSVASGPTMLRGGRGGSGSAGARSGIRTRGLFRASRAGRFLRTSTGRCAPDSTSSGALVPSRILPDASRKERSAPRVHPPFDEVCMVFQPAGDEPLKTLSLFNKLRDTHAQYDSSTRAPFPLHELQLPYGSCGGMLDEPQGEDHAERAVSCATDFARRLGVRCTPAVSEEVSETEGARPERSSTANVVAAFRDARLAVPSSAGSTHFNRPPALGSRPLLPPAETRVASPRSPQLIAVAPGHRAELPVHRKRRRRSAEPAKVEETMSQSHVRLSVGGAPAYAHPSDWPEDLSGATHCPSASQMLGAAQSSTVLHFVPQAPSSVQRFGEQSMEAPLSVITV